VYPVLHLDLNAEKYTVSSALNIVLDRLLNTFEKGKFSYYWFQTGMPTFLVRMIEQSDFDLQSMVNGVEAGENAFSDYSLVWVGVVLITRGCLPVRPASFAAENRHPCASCSKVMEEKT
jgi:hypothetical protein